MTLTSVTSSQETYYSAQAEKEWFANSYLSRMVGAHMHPDAPELGVPVAGPFTPIVLYPDYRKGVTMSIPYTDNFSAAASSNNLSEGTDLVGNETQMTENAVTVTPLERGIAVLFTTFSENKIAWSMVDEVNYNLNAWASEKFDLDTLAIAEANTTNIVYSGNGTEDDDLDSSDTMGVVDFHKAVTLLEVAQARPAGGESGGYISISHPYSTYGLKRETEWQTYNSRKGNVAITDNPLFKHPSLLGWLDNVALFSSTLITRGANGNTPSIQIAENMVFSARCLALGAVLTEVTNSAARIWRTAIRTDDDYGRQKGMARLGHYAPVILRDKYLCRIVSPAIAL